MSLEKAIEELASKQKPYSKYCSWQMTINTLTDKDKKALEEAWAKGYSANIIVKALRAEGHKATAESIRAHRRGVCKCPKN
jgi:hypothetical protein